MIFLAADLKAALIPKAVLEEDEIRATSRAVDGVLMWFPAFFEWDNAHLPILEPVRSIGKSSRIMKRKECKVESRNTANAVEPRLDGM